MQVEYAPILVFSLIILIVFILFWAYLLERKNDSLRKERALLKGWNYERSSSSAQGFKVSGTNGSYMWELEQRKGGDRNGSLIFTSKSLTLPVGVFYFSDKRETDLLLKPFMKYILKLGEQNISKDNDKNSSKAEIFSYIREAKPLDIPSGNSRWKYGALATSIDFGYKVLSSGFQAEIDSLSLINISSLPPSVILCPDRLEIKWKTGKVDAEKMELIIESSLRLMNVLDRAIRNS